MLKQIHQNLICQHQNIIIKRFDANGLLSLEDRHWECVDCGKIWKTVDDPSKALTRKLT